MKQHENIYSYYQRQVKDKDTAVISFMRNMLAKTQSMFRYDNLPDTIPCVEFERLLQETGTAMVTSVDGSLYALGGSLGGELDAYNRPTQYTVANVALNISQAYNVADDRDGVLCVNDTNTDSLLPMIGKYAVLYTDGVISLNTASILTRITMLISAKDDKTKESADAFLTKILGGEFSIIGESAFFDGVRMQTAPTTNSVYITQLIEMVQYYRASLLNELGLNANYNMKRERLNLGEVTMNEDVLLPYVDNMLLCRRDACARINAKYGTEISVMLSSSWRLEHENFAAQVEATDTPEEEEQPEEQPEEVQPEEQPEEVQPEEQPEENAI